ncbi:MAG: hypothetical protein IKZ55_07465, partial [Bacteroidales bacterium]|nr:hypothetical protein [Bacteroidales bacterium]
GAAASLISGAVGGVCDLKNVPAVWTKTAMIAAGGLGGGVSSLIAGGEFIDGFCNGLICAGLNHALHYVAKNVTGPDDPPGESNKQQSTDYKRITDKKYFWALKHHYLEGNGVDIFLTKDQFIDLVSHGKIDYANAVLGDDGYYTTTINFYETNNDLECSFGVATIKYQVLENNTIKYSAFKDTYDFDPKPWGVRSTRNEIITRTYNTITNGNSFSIYYNKVLFK